MAANWAALKVSELKEELKRRSLPTSGLKADLVARLVAADAAPAASAAAEKEEPPPTPPRAAAKRSKVMEQPAVTTTTTTSSTDFASIADLALRTQALLDECCGGASQEDEEERRKLALAYLHRTLLPFQEDDSSVLLLLRVEMDFWGSNSNNNHHKQKLERAYFALTGELLPRSTTTSASSVLASLPKLTPAFYHALTGEHTEVEDDAVLRRAVEHHLAPRYAVRYESALTLPQPPTLRAYASSQHLRRVLALHLLSRLVASHRRRARWMSSFSPSGCCCLYLARNQAGEVAVVESSSPASASSSFVEYSALRTEPDALLGRQILDLLEQQQTPTCFSAAVLSTATTAKTEPVSAIKDAAAACLVGKRVLVSAGGGGDGDVVAELVAALLASSSSSSSARILLVSPTVRRAQRLAHRARKQHPPLLALTDIVTLGEEDEEDADFSAHKCGARLDKLKDKLLLQAASEFAATANGVVDSARALFPTCRSLPGGAVRQAEAKMEEWELFALQGDLARARYLRSRRCRLVLASPWTLRAGAAAGQVDYVILDGLCSSLAELALYSGHPTRALVCVTDKPECAAGGGGFLKHLVLERTSAAAYTHSAGFATRVQLVRCGGGSGGEKEACAMAVRVERLAKRLGYDSVHVYAVSEDVRVQVEDALASKRMMGGSSPCGLWTEEQEEDVARAGVVVVVAGSEAVTVAELERRFPHAGAVVGLLVGGSCTGQQDRLDLVLGERFGEDFDSELRAGSLHSVTSSAELDEVLVHL